MGKEPLNRIREFFGRHVPESGKIFLRYVIPVNALY